MELCMLQTLATEVTGKQDKAAAGALLDGGQLHLK